MAWVYLQANRSQRQTGLFHLVSPKGHTTSVSLAPQAHTFRPCNFNLFELDQSYCIPVRASQRQRRTLYQHGAKPHVAEESEAQGLNSPPYYPAANQAVKPPTHLTPCNKTTFTWHSNYHPPAIIETENKKRASAQAGALRI